MAASSHPLELRRLRRIGLRTPTLDAARAFYVDQWLLEPVDDHGHETVDHAFLRATGPEHHVLQLHRSASHGIDHIGFAVDESANVDEAAEHLENHGVPIVVAPGPLDGPAGGYGLRCVDPEGRVLEISANVRSNAPRDPGPGPRSLAHVVLNTADIDRSVEFYVGVLGFRLTDWSEHQMAFLRVGTDHHTVAFNQAAWASLNHVAYEVDSIDHFMRSIGRLKRSGTEPLWGPGRHGPGNNTFAYFEDAAGFVAEFTSEVQQIGEDWLPRVWQRVPDQADLWGTAGPPSAALRENMAGRPDPGPFPGEEQR